MFNLFSKMNIKGIEARFSYPEYTAIILNWIVRMLQIGCER